MNPSQVKVLRIAGMVSVALLLAAGLPATAQCPTLHTASDSSATSSDNAPKTPAKPLTLYITVRDKHGDLITNLSQGDFSITDEGRPQTITAFSHDANYPATVGLLIQTSSGLRNALSEVRTQSDNFIDLLLGHPNDKVFVIHFDHQVELLQDVTNLKGKLHKAVDELTTAQPQIRRDNNGNGNGDDQNGNGGDNNGGQNGGGSQGGGGYPGNGGGYPGGGQGGGRGGNSGGGSQRGVRQNVLLNDAIYLAANEIAKPLPGRKALVLVSDGVDHYSQESLTDALEAAQRANVSIYTIYIKPQEDLGNNGGNQQSGSGRNGGGFPGSVGWPGGGGGGRGGGGGSRGGQRQPQSATVDGKKVLERIARETGGASFEATKKDNVDSIVKAIDTDLASQYVLTYTPDQNGSTVDYRKIAVTVKKDDRKIQVREGYYPQQ